MTRGFSIPLDWVGMADDEALEIELRSDDQTVHLQHELAQELRQLPELKVEEFVRKAIDIPQLIYIAGAAGGIAQGIDVICRWYRVKRESDKNIHITIRTAEGQADLSTDSLEDAKELAKKLTRVTKP